ncbi:MAG TPA: hypothetical protein DDW49_06800 [Deltaproteobacteria bacterium]|nr:MAG: hypothetical protein A2048_09735 [Deltaproteobacteria bacterium GWA2_45_12]HBF13079.1 hypothetical protein [Deltaproteobacteria bacterium]
MRFKNLIILTVYLGFLIGPSLHAQEAPPPLDESDEFSDLSETNALEEPDSTEVNTDLSELEDPPNPAENILDSPSSVLEEEEPTAASHEIIFSFTSKVQFFAWTRTKEGIKASEEPYMEVDYTNECHTSLELSEKKQIKKVVCDVTSDRGGSLAANEFFECRLDIDINDMDAEVSTRIIKTQKKQASRPGDVNTDLTEEKTTLALKIHFTDDAKESWYSLCTDFGSGSQLNTEGEKENYNLEVIKKITPGISSIVVEDFDPTTSTRISLTTEDTIIEDTDIANNISLSGEGFISIEPEK